MKRIGTLCAVVLLVLTGLLLNGCRGQALEAFSSDGCSLFPDMDHLQQKSWCLCCLQHDKAYWRGGTEQERLAADVALRDCVAAQTGDQALAETMYECVRFGGAPWFPNWYRWGYGWEYGRGYQALTPQGSALAADMLAEFEATVEPGECVIVAPQWLR
jgi:hypothetical protein